MAKYNCIIKELPLDGQGQPKILGRAFLQDLSQIPDGWEVKLRGSFISRDTDLQQIMCTSTNPLMIFKKTSIEQDVTIKFRNFRAIADDTLNSQEVAVVNDDFVCEEIIRFQAAFSTELNIEAGVIDGVGEETSEFWKSYGHGMNLVGECPNMECDSRKKAEGAETKVFYRNGYGEIYLPDDKFSCPACDGPSFQISNFVLSCGRSLIKYKKTGIDSEVKEVTLESDGPPEEYKTFDTQTDQSLIDYDFVLILTVATDQSFYYCMACDDPIDDVDDEEMLSCGHSYHKSTCYTGSRMGCIVCESEPLESIGFLLTVGNS